MQLLFATSNKDKIREAEDILQLKLDSVAVDVPEIQSLDPKVVAVQKAVGYYTILKRPLFVEDVSLSFTALKGLPGPYINDFSKALGNTGLIELLTNQMDRSCTAITTLALSLSVDNILTFQGIVEGTVAKEPLGDNGFGWDQIFIPKGFTKTFAQMTSEEKNQVSMRALALGKLKDWLTAHPL